MAANAVHRHVGANSSSGGWRPIVVLVLALSVPLVQADACGDIAAAAQGGMSKESSKVTGDQDRIAQAQSNAATCIQRIKDMLANMTAPQFPDIASISASQIINYLSNRACQVVMSKVDQEVARPIGNEINDWNNQVYDSIGGINNQVRPITGGNVLGTQSGSSAMGRGAAAINQVAPTQPAVSSGSVWNRLSCAVGANCN